MMLRFFTAALMLAVLACSDSSDPAGAPTLSVSPLLDSVFVGDTIPAGRLVAVYRDANGQVQPTSGLRWRSGTPSVVAVDSASGRVIALARGEGVVEAIASGATGRALVLVSRPLDIALLMDTVYMLPGDTYTFVTA